MPEQVANNFHFVVPLNAATGDLRARFMAWDTNFRCFLVTAAGFGRDDDAVQALPHCNLPEDFDAIAHTLPHAGGVMLITDTGELWTAHPVRSRGLRKLDYQIDLDAAVERHRTRTAAMLETKSKALAAEQHRIEREQADLKAQAERREKYRKRAETEAERFRRLAEEALRGDLDDADAIGILRGEA